MNYVDFSASSEKHRQDSKLTSSSPLRIRVTYCQASPVHRSVKNKPVPLARAAGLLYKPRSRAVSDTPGGRARAKPRKGAG